MPVRLKSHRSHDVVLLCVGEQQSPCPWGKPPGWGGEVERCGRRSLPCIEVPPIVPAAPSPPHPGCHELAHQVGLGRGAAEGSAGGLRACTHAQQAGRIWPSSRQLLTSPNCPPTHPPTHQQAAEKVKRQLAKELRVPLQPPLPQPREGSEAGSAASSPRAGSAAGQAGAPGAGLHPYNVRRAALALERYSDNMPAAKRRELADQIRRYLGAMAPPAAAALPALPEEEEQQPKQQLQQQAQQLQQGQQPEQQQQGQQPEQQQQEGEGEGDGGLTPLELYGGLLAGGWGLTRIYRKSCSSLR